MKPEPLKNKIKNRMGCIYFNGKDVKSAVEGLKQDLKKHMISSRDIAGDYSKAYSVGMEQAIKLVDEWFEDVIK